MKRLIVLILATCLLSQSLLLSAHAQTNNASTIEQIRASIASLEKLERNGIAVGEAASLNREFLTSRRKQLREALKRRETALTEYLLVAGSSLSESEQKAVQASLANVRMEMRKLDSLIADADAASSEGESDADTRVREADSAPVVSAGWRRAAAETSAETSSAAEPVARDDDDSCGKNCEPKEGKNDLVIDARTGAPKEGAKMKFGLHDTARIVITNKNPFRYQYQVKIKATPIAEPAIAAFFGNFTFPAVDVDKAKDATKASGNELAPLAACTDKAVAELNKDKDRLAAQDDGSVDGSLRNLYEGNDGKGGIKGEYDKRAAKFKAAQEKLYDGNATCADDLCKTATDISSTLQSYKPDLEGIGKSITRFRDHAVTLGDDAEALLNNTKTPPGCRDRLKELVILASNYQKTADDFEKGVATITAGKKTFDEAVKTIDKVLHDPNAFSEVHSAGPFSSPNDVEITVERKDLRAADSKFEQVGDATKINFGGGARFAIAGGVVASPFETITYKRVPAIIDGRSTTIIGAENSSNSRILPILMLHGRLFEMNNKYISGVHLSLGITAKPNDTGTNVEWLVGPSVSFIEERLFLTVGGYAGRRQVLEGNLTPGQELPADFKEDIPVNNRLVWKPGFALTYKFK
jgi:hypothetical protein